MALRRDLPARPAAWRRPANGLAFISQSGALAEEFIDKANARGLPLTSVVSVGNAVHLGVEDYLAWLGERPEIGAALLYVESIEDHERFRSVARKVAATKPVIALFGGRTDVGGRAASAHTGAIANDDAAIDAFCASCGIIRVESLRRLLVAAKAFGRFPQGLGKRALILSNSGGPGVICADRAVLEGLELGAAPPGDGRRAAPAALPPEASVANPIDLLADAREDRFGLDLRGGDDPRRPSLRHGADDPCRALHGRRRAGDRPAGRARAQRAAAADALMMGTLPGKAEWFATMERAGVPMFNDVEEMAEAAGLLARYPALQEFCPSRHSAHRSFPRPEARDSPGKSEFLSIYRHLHHCCIFATFRWT